MAMSPQSLTSRRTVSRRAAYGLMASVIGLALFASGTPSPLYGTYQEMWSLRPVLLTLVFATYAFGVLATLLLAGPVSDHVGRRPVLLVALGLLMAATIMFMLATSVVWLFAARALQGLATGLALSAASAALLDLHPQRDSGAVGLHNGAASAGGMGLGVLVSALMVGSYGGSAFPVAEGTTISRPSWTHDGTAAWTMRPPPCRSAAMTSTLRQPNRSVRSPPPYEPTA